MTGVMKCFKKFVSGVWDDYMLVGCLLSPILMGLAFKFGITALESYVCEHFGKSAIISPYYLVFDLVLSYMIPVMFSFAGVMTMLEELDNGTAKYLIITPIGKKGYLMSRIGMPSLIGILYSVVALLIFSIGDTTLLMKIVISVVYSLMGIMTSFIVVAFAKNKVEGMAMIKLTGIFMVGVPVAVFVHSPIQYVCGVVPSYWLSKIATDKNYLYILPGIAVFLIWMYFLNRRFERRFK